MPVTAFVRMRQHVMVQRLISTLGHAQHITKVTAFILSKKQQW